MVPPPTPTPPTVAAPPRPPSVPCTSQCWACDASLTLSNVGSPRRPAIRAALMMLFCEKQDRRSSSVAEAIYKARTKIWPDNTGTTIPHAHRLVLQLVASGILSYEVHLAEEGSKGQGSVHLKFAVCDNKFLFEQEERWELFT